MVAAILPSLPFVIFYAHFIILYRAALEVTQLVDSWSTPASVPASQVDE